ncbi:restriction endonuclease [Mycobacteroides abscessus]|uniref:Restriction endonuclease type IV Mrr domain-containing protein n=1 Tax=Mycobacteroides abscessus subsp. massiliense TaxID=1962118 RepID=A0A1U2FI78_9MYCO|nr:restriction endonuclease [Mycobacteroides abscessus]EIV67416.1 hypothetical protein MMCCUG48898_0745 [Mycobacteroides abscessus subsp. massiliense CCUG 48898 = JCM 15300]MBL3748574.1 restriction endonuclease [Mycobacteroides abscessus subsp. massiliense]ORA86071.1 hypothetical protein BST32_24625 [Mycobacteroides abscessus subsp. massiliense]SKE61479.1 Uncharacterised protein [Mycobacteroides abscessus subsp. massiliense]SKH62438.1 Uncharacterised protein [Mycobacteroides abscessus subsp. m
MEDILDEPEYGKPIDSSDIEKLVKEIASIDSASDWQTGVQVDLTSKVWRPPAVSADRSKILYVCFGQGIPKFVADRLRLASEKNIQVVVALNIAALYGTEILTTLSDCEADVMVLDDYREERRYKHRHFLAAIADVDVPVVPISRQEISRKVWATIDDGTNHQKGRRLEALLAFLFSQVADLKVVERNYRTATEEVDVVLQVDNISNRAWQKSVPFIIVEAKNRAEKASQQTVSALITKLQTKRGSAKIAILVSRLGFTDDARNQELRFSTSDMCIAMLDSSAIVKLIEADDLDMQLEDLIRYALLR